MILIFPTAMLLFTNLFRNRFSQQFIYDWYTKTVLRQNSLIFRSREIKNKLKTIIQLLHQQKKYVFSIAKML